MRKFGRGTNHRKSLLRNLAISLFTHGQINTTEAKAKDLRPFAEKLMTRCKESTLTNRRYLLSSLYNNETIVNKMFEELSPLVRSRNGGYTRIIKLSHRGMDTACIQVIRNDK